MWWAVVVVCWLVDSLVNAQQVSALLGGDSSLVQDFIELWLMGYSNFRGAEERLAWATDKLEKRQVPVHTGPCVCCGLGGVCCFVLLFGVASRLRFLGCSVV